MAAIYSPADRGFEARLAAIDRCQIALLRELVGLYGPRLTLKGGMAMRAVFGSLRLTKDIDFDRDPSLGTENLKAGLPRALVRAAANAGIREPAADITKLTQTTVRARLTGRALSGDELRFEVEISGRGPVPQEWKRKETVVPPSSYGMAPFVVESYSNEALAAMKVAAAMSEARNVPRDVYDLHDLLLAGADPSALLAERAEPARLEEIRDHALTKLELITFAQARDELLAYLPADVRDSLDEDHWIEMTLHVGMAIEAWAGEALKMQAGKALR